MFTMYDSVTETEIPKEPHAVAAYINGDYANYEACKKLFPRARLLTISVTGDVVADCYDMEKGDYPNDKAAELYRTAKNGGVWRPCFYAQLSGNMPAVKASLNTVQGIVRDDVRFWVAYYNGLADLPAGYDAHQFTKSALGRNLDESICADTFFKPADKAVDVPVSEPVKVPINLDVSLTYDPHTDSWSGVTVKKEDEKVG
jgi:hypothetical protein